jgi:hypothetical protein
MRPLFKILIAGVLLTVGTGCAKENKGGSVANIPPSGCGSRCETTTGTGTPPPPTGTGENPGQTGYASGSTADLQTYQSSLAELFYKSNPNSPTNVRVNIDIRRKKEAVIISYRDGGRVVEAAFGVIHPYSGIQNEQHNGWVNQDGKSVWKGFFQDEWGAIVLVVDRMLSQGDGVPGQFLGGSIWFQNFNKEYYPNFPYQGPTKMCWQITMGPYDCRSFLVSGVVNMISSYYPTTKGPNKQNHYQKLGDFDGISRDAAGF